MKEFWKKGTCSICKMEDNVLELIRATPNGYKTINTCLYDLREHVERDFDKTWK